MSDIQLAIEGEDAVSATEELLSISGISGSYTISDGCNYCRDCGGNNGDR
ncbi:MAG: hypothetical protein VKN72_25065 [Nostocales cyanobacterium 94392]|nr:hypothetical protein [Nostocales cyanobacterium 94392]